MKASSRQAERRAFALPLVVLLSVSATLVAAVMLQRMSAQALTVQRQLEDYQTTHQARGLREAVDFWLTTVSGRRITDNLADDGKAMDLQLADGSTVSLYVTDGQSGVLSDFSGLRDEDRQTAIQILQQLHAASPGLAGTERTFGPVSVSAASAPFEVLQAVASAVVGPDGGTAFAQSLVQARAQKRLANTDLNEAATKAKAEGETRAKLMRLVTADPTVWRVVVDVRAAQSDRLTARAEMFAVLPSSRGRDRTASVWQRTSILNFRWIPVDDVTKP